MYTHTHTCLSLSQRTYNTNLNVSFWLGLRSTRQVVKALELTWGCGNLSSSLSSFAGCAVTPSV